jgi:protoporphyrinogen oxidase
MINEQKIIILGAGLAGLSAAWHLQRRGRETLVFEKEAEPGGLCRSSRVNGFTFDCDGHLLHFRRRESLDLVRHLLGSNLQRHKRSAWVSACRRMIPYPFQANLRRLPAPIVKECLLGMIDAAKNNHLPAPDNFLIWINRTFGKGIARHFMVPYNTKFWTVPPQRMTCAWLDGFVPVPSLGQAVEGALQDNREEFGYNRWFWYPKKGGIAELPRAMATEIRGLCLGDAVAAIDPRRKEVAAVSGRKEKYDCLISTVPLPELASLIKGLPASTRGLFHQLRWNSIFNLNLGLSGSAGQKAHWVYFPDKEQSFFRAGFYHNFSAFCAPRGKAALYAEVSYSAQRPIDKQGIIPRIKKDLLRCGIIARSSSICAQAINDIKYGYPIYDHNYASARAGISKYLQRHNIIPCGRYGSWRYLSMEGAILDGKAAASVLGNGNLGKTV